MKVYIFMLTTHILQGINCRNIYLTPTQAIVDLNSTLTFTCSYHEYGKVSGTKWNVGGKYAPSVVRNQDGSCTGSGIFANKSIYSVGCPSEASFNVTILQIHLNDHNVTWECFDPEKESNNVTIFVKVPVTRVVLFRPNASLIKEHSRQTIKCSTSKSRPKPKVSWYIHDSANSTKHFISKNISTKIISTSLDGIITVESTLLFYPNRSTNKLILNCEGWTDNKSLAVQSSGMFLNISYPPDRPPDIHGYEDDNTYRLIESEVGVLSCSVSSGNPLPRLTWICYNKEPTSFVVDRNTAVSNVTWIGSRNQSYCTCVSNHSWSETINSANVSIDILFPPLRPTLTFRSSIVLDFIKVIINNTLNVECKSEGNPSPNITWTGYNTSVHKSNLRVLIDDKSDKIYKCLAKVQMTRSDGTKKIAENETALTVKVLYPPETPFFRHGHIHGDIINNNLLELHKGDSLTIYCDAIGNPMPDMFWENSDTNKSFISIQSIISAMNKTCTATNYMEETVGESRRSFSKSTLQIKVFSPSRIDLFQANVNLSQGAFIVDENDEVSLTCNAEGYPDANMTIINPHGKIILNISKTNSARHVLRNALCGDAGKYACIARNLMSDNHPYQSDLILIVRCSPRPSSDDFRTVKTMTVLDADVVFSFTAKEYLDEPNNTYFTWFHHHQSVKNDGRKFKITTNGAHSELVIRNITQKDVGQITVHVSNSIGKYIHFYDIIIKGKPKTPLHFHIVENSITDSSVILTWTTGFNGGENQTFILLYKISPSDIWNNKTIADTGEQQINFTLIGLARMTSYDVKMFSRNAFGDSDVSLSVHFKTKSRFSTSRTDVNETNFGIFVGVGIGSFAGIMVTVASSIIFYRIYRKKQRTTRDTQGNAHTSLSSFTYENLNSKQNDEKDENKDYATVTYEDMETSLQELGKGSESRSKIVQNAPSEYINFDI